MCTATHPHHPQKNMSKPNKKKHRKAPHQKQPEPKRNFNPGIPKLTFKPEAAYLLDLPAGYPTPDRATAAACMFAAQLARDAAFEMQRIVATRGHQITPILLTHFALGTLYGALEFIRLMPKQAEQDQAAELLFLYFPEAIQNLFPAFFAQTQRDWEAHLHPKCQEAPQHDNPAGNTSRHSPSLPSPPVVGVGAYFEADPPSGDASPSNGERGSAQP